jgi:hypothetical protein
MTDILKTGFDYWPLIVPLLFTIAAYHDLKFAQSSNRWYLTSGLIKSIDSNGRMVYEYNAGGMKYSSEFLNIREYLGNCKNQQPDTTSEPVYGKYKRCPAGKSWLPAFLYRWDNQIPHWKTSTSDENKTILHKAGKERAARIALKYSAGDRVNAYYDPAHPETAVLKTYEKASNWYSDAFVRMYYLGIALTAWLLVHLLADQYGYTDWLDLLIYGAVILTFLRWVTHLFSIRRYAKNTTGFAEYNNYQPLDKIRWKQTQGTVYVSFVRSRKLEGGKNLGPERAQIIYKFQVSGKTYSAGYLSKPTDGQPDEIIRKHPEKSQIGVLYDPANPSRSKLILDEKREQ